MAKTKNSKKKNEASVKEENKSIETDSVVNAVVKVGLKMVRTEKSFDLANVSNKYTFYVDTSATKIDIRNAIKQKFGVEAIKVWTSILPGKLKKDAKFGTFKRRREKKKAIVMLGKGDKIKDFTKI